MTCCFIGHRNIGKDNFKINELENIVENLILNCNVKTFLFGSKSKFDDLCYEVVTKLKEKYPHIVRIYVRAEFPFIHESYYRYLLTFYEKTYFPEKILNAGRLRYVERNFEMINNSNYVVFYCKKDYVSPKFKNIKNCVSLHKSKSGTHLAYEYAKKQKTIKIINIVKN